MGTNRALYASASYANETSPGKTPKRKHLRGVLWAVITTVWRGGAKESGLPPLQSCHPARGRLKTTIGLGAFN